VKLRDVNNDGKLNADDRIILGQGDPKFLWGLTNTFTYNNLSLSIFMHGVNGATRRNNLLVDGVFESVRQNTTKKNWWTPDNPTNEWIANDIDAAKMGGVYCEQVYENADFIRIKDVTLSYELP